MIFMVLKLVCPKIAFWVNAFLEWAIFGQQAVAAGVAFQGVHVTAGGVDDAIVDEAEKAGCDMIVMVTHGRGPVGEFLFGSHTKKVISRSKLPVFVLH